MSDQATERIFQDDIIRQLVANGWLLAPSVTIVVRSLEETNPIH